MIGGTSKLHRTTKPDDDYVWNSFGIIRGSVRYFESEISNWQTSFDS